MILTDLYVFERKPYTKAAQRMECVASTRSYALFENQRANKNTKASERRDATLLGGLVAYYGGRPSCYDDNKGATHCIGMRDGCFSGVYVLNGSEGIAFGDVKGTRDGLVFVLHDVAVVDGCVIDGAAIDVYVARGKKNDMEAVCRRFARGDLAAEMEELQHRAANTYEPYTASSRARDNKSNL